MSEPGYHHYPRRRIVIRRELQRLKLNGDSSKYKLLLHQYQYDGLDTCAVDGLCATACPVNINTGDLIKRLRSENHSSFANKIALAVARNFGTVEFFTSGALNFGHGINKVFGRRAMTRLTKGLRMVIPRFPLWTLQLSSSPSVPVKANNKSYKINADTHVVYFPACISRLMGKGIGRKKNLMETFISVSKKAGISVIIPKNIKGSCCGQIFSSKGFYDAYRYSVNNIVETLWRASQNGVLPVVTDVSSCAYTMMGIRNAISEENKIRYDALRIMDTVDYLHDIVMPACPKVEKKNSIVLHPVCSLEKMRTQSKFVAVAKYFADQVTVPLNAGCCGMAGDRGFLFPELTASATKHEAMEVRINTYDGYYSSTRTCEMAMSEAVNANYESILYLVDEAVAEA